MKIAFVTKVKEKDLKKIFPWAKITFPFMGGLLLQDGNTVAIQKEMFAMAKAQIKESAADERRFAAWQKKNKPARRISISRPNWSRPKRGAK